MSGGGSFESIINSVKKQISPIHPEGYRFIAAFALATIVLFALSEFLGYVGIALTLWCVYFFRDPARVIPSVKGMVVSPADGTVSDVSDAVPPEELGLGTMPVPRVCVFMSVFNCHVNRMPLEGKIEDIVYRPGKFLNAELDKASVHNERNSLIVSVGKQKVAVVQIAGLVARRIVCFAEKGDTLKIGERFGLIRFGSRLDVYLPKGSKILVGVGQKMTAGETMIADMSGKRAVPQFTRE